MRKKLTFSFKLKKYRIITTIFLLLTLPALASSGDESGKIAQKYWKKVKSRIGDQWQPPLEYLSLYHFRENETVSSKVHFSLDNNGKTVSVKVLQSSGVEEFDASCIKAIEKTKLPPPPKEVDEASLKQGMLLTFSGRL